MMSKATDELTSSDQKLSIQDAITHLERIARADPTREWSLVVRKTNPGGLTAHQTTPVTAIQAGFDWEAGQVILVPGKALTELSPNDVTAIHESVRKGQSWHAYKADKQRLERISGALGTQVSSFAAALLEIERLRAAIPAGTQATSGQQLHHGHGAGCVDVVRREDVQFLIDLAAQEYVPAFTRSTLVAIARRFATSQHGHGALDTDDRRPGPDGLGLPAIDATKIADEVVTRWNREGRMPPMAWDFRGLVIDGIRTAIGAARGEESGKRSTSAATASGHELPNDTAAPTASLTVANGGSARVASAGCAPLATAGKASFPKLPKEAPAGLLVSMAIRYDHGLGCPGFYDRLPAVPGAPKLSHQQRLDGTLNTMRQLYEEVSGHGFWSPEREATYVAIARGKGTCGGEPADNKGEPM